MMNVNVWPLVILNFVAFSDAQQFFLGPSHKFMCNCEGNKCYSNGLCKENAKCKKGYFGYACQYMNVFDYTMSPISAIADEKYDTCVTGKTRLEIKFNYTRVRFLRLRVEDYGLYESLQFVFKKAESCQTCDGRHVLPEDNVVAYYCRYPIEADGITIINKNKIPICHVEVSNGRNFALRASKKVPPSINNSYSAIGLTDGITDFQNASCYLGVQHPKSTEPFEIKIHLVWSILLSIVEIYDIPPDFKLVKTLNVKITEKDTNKIVSSGIIESNDLQVKRLILEEDLPNADVVSMTPYKQFGACEIKLIGDCPPGKYGFSCVSDCPKKCSWCTTAGLCIEKTDKITIKNSTKCSPDCVDGICDDQGFCLCGCRPGGYDCRIESEPEPPFKKVDKGMKIVSYNAIPGAVFKEGKTIDFNCSTYSEVPVSMDWTWSYNQKRNTIFMGNTSKTYWIIMLYIAHDLDNDQGVTCTSNNGSITTYLTVKPKIILIPNKPVIEGPDEVTALKPETWTCYANGASFVQPTVSWRDETGNEIVDNVNNDTYTEEVPHRNTLFDVMTTVTIKLPAVDVYILRCHISHVFHKYRVEKSTDMAIKVLGSKETFFSKNGCNDFELFVGPSITVIIIICTHVALGMIVFPV